MAQPKDRARDANRCDWMLADTPHRSANTEDAFLVLLVIDGIAQLANLYQLSTKVEHISDGFASELSEPVFADRFFHLRFGQERHDGFAYGGAVCRVTASNAGSEPNAA